MDWGNDYFTFSDTNIEYIWRFLQAMHEQRLALPGHRSTEWCPRCGTSISRARAASAATRTAPTRRSSSASRCSTGRASRSSIWTTTPWTLPANVAAAVQPGRRVRPPRERRVGRGRALPGRDVRRARARRAELVGLALRRARSTTCPRPPGSSTASSRGTRSRSTRAPASSTSRPGCGAEDFELVARPRPARAHAGRRGRALLRPTTAGCTASRPARPPSRSSADLARARPARRTPARSSTATPSAGAATRRSSSASPTTGSSPSTSCARSCSTANATVEWTPAYMGKRMDDWLRNMGDWNISRRRYFGLPAAVLPLRLRAPDRRSARRPSSRSCATGRPRPARGAPPAVDRRRRDPLRGVRNEDVRRIPEVGDVWLDAGIVPFSTLGWENPEWVEGGYATGAAEGLTGRRSSRPRLLGDVVPGRLGLRDARADPSLVLLAALHVGRARWARRRSGRCSATRRCSTSTAARCTAPGGT